MTKTTRSFSRFIAIIVSVFPLVTILMCMLLLGPPSGKEDIDSKYQPTIEEADEVGNNNTEANVRQHSGLLGFIIPLIYFAFIVAKLLAVIANLSRWYYGWIFHMIELNLVVFACGLIVIVSIFSLEFSFSGLLKLLSLFFLLWANYHLKSYWSGRQIRDWYRVGHYIHAEKGL